MPIEKPRTVIVNVPPQPPCDRAEEAYQVAFQATQRAQMNAANLTTARADISSITKLVLDLYVKLKLNPATQAIEQPAFEVEHTSETHIKNVNVEWAETGTGGRLLRIGGKQWQWIAPKIKTAAKYLAVVGLTWVAAHLKSRFPQVAALMKLILEP